MKDLGEVNRVGMIGIGGSGMRGLAYLLKERGLTIEGTDSQRDKLIRETSLAGYELLTDQEMTQRMNGYDWLIYSDAVAQDNPLLTKAKQLGVHTVNYSEALGKLASHYKVLAVAGTHGKSTTTAMAAKILVDAGLDPTVLIGASVPEWGGENARLGQGSYFLVEADEYRDHFLALQPKIIIITAIDFDHPDYFASLDDVKKSYKNFVGRLAEDGAVITTKEVAISLPELQRPKRMITVDMGTNDEQRVDLLLPGDHMQVDAKLAIELAEQVGIDKAAALSSLAQFAGIARRMEKLGRIYRMDIFSDYGHHPTEIKATIKARRSAAVNEKLLVIFEAHTTERLKSYREEFAAALALADGIIVVPTFKPTGREAANKKNEEEEILLDKDLARRVADVVRVDSYNKLPDELKGREGEYDTAIAFTAGVLDEELRKLVKKK